MCPGLATDLDLSQLPLSISAFHQTKKEQDEWVLKNPMSITVRAATM